MRRLSDVILYLRYLYNDGGESILAIFFVRLALYLLNSTSSVDWLSSAVSEEAGGDMGGGSDEEVRFRSVAVTPWLRGEGGGEDGGEGSSRDRSIMTLLLLLLLGTVAAEVLDVTW